MSQTMLEATVVQETKKEKKPDTQIQKIGRNLNPFLILLKCTAFVTMDFEK